MVVVNRLVASILDIKSAMRCELVQLQCGSVTVQLRFSYGSVTVQYGSVTVQLRFSFGEIARRKKLFSAEKK